LIGARVLAGAQVRLLRALFATVIVVLAVEMLYRGIRGSF